MGRNGGDDLLLDRIPREYFSFTGADEENATVLRERQRSDSILDVERRRIRSIKTVRWTGWLISPPRCMKRMTPPPANMIPPAMNAVDAHRCGSARRSWYTRIRNERQPRMAD